MAFVRHGARIPVIAIGTVVLEQTPSQAVAGIVGAHVAVVTDDRVARTNTVFAVIAHGARVPVNALALGQVLVGASSLSVANIFGAIVVVVAQVYVVTAHVLGFVHIAVTVVVDSVAALRGRNSRITGGQTFFRAYPEAPANPVFVTRLARGGQRQFNRLARARADPGISDALGDLHPFHGHSLDTGEPPRAFFSRSIHELTSAAAKRPLFSIVDTDIL